MNNFTELLSEMLPVGMVANGGLAAQILADLAKQQRRVPNWEAFHYEKISPECFELTGGVVAHSASGTKRWLEPHDCISIHISSLITEMQKQGLLSSVAELPTISTTTNTTNTTTSAMTRNSEHAGILHLTLALPQDEAGRQRLLKTFHLQADFFGAQVLTCHLE
ncbi:MAG: hypothetical protein K2P84_02220 [Undibacterium sp.]|nr:hypothetical protein [Undibacterium sp.]